MIKSIFLLLFIISTSLTFAQNGWNLAQCTDSALVNNRSLRQNAIDTYMAEHLYRQSKYDFGPRVSGSLSQSYYFGRNLDPVSNEFTQTSRQNASFSLSGNLVLFDGLSRYYSLKKSALLVENEQYNRLIEIRNIKLAITTTYLQVMLSAELIRLGRSHINFTNEEFEKIKALIEAQVKTSKDLLPIQTELARNELALIRATNDFLLAQEQLKQMMQLANGTIFSVDTTQEILTSDTAIYQKMESFPEVEKQNCVIQQKNYDLKISQAGYFPTLSLYAGVGSVYSDSYFLVDPTTGAIYLPSLSDQFGGNLYQSISFSLSIPIYNQNQTRTNQQLKTLEIERAELEKEQLLIDLKGVIFQLETDLKNATLELAAALKVVDYALQDFNQAEIQYQQGVMNMSELLRKKELLFDAQSNLVQSKYNYYFKGKILQIYHER